MNETINVESPSYSCTHSRENIYLLSEGKIDDINNQLNLIDKFDIESRHIKWEEMIASLAFGGCIAFLITAFTVNHVPDVFQWCIAFSVVCLIVGILSIWYAIRARKKTNDHISLPTQHIREVISKCQNSLLNSNES